MHRTTSVTTFDAQDLVMALSPRVSIVLVAGLGLHTLLFGFPGGSFTATASLGVVKALSWSFTIRAVISASPMQMFRACADPKTQCQYTGSWCIAAAIEIFSVMSTLDPLTASSDLHAWSRVVSSSLALGQVIQMLPKRSPGRSVLWALLLIALLPFVYSIYATRAAQSSSPRSFGFSQRHPVDALAREARADFENLLQRQSQNYTAARQEYQRRYGLEPPPGFEAWYEFATLHQSPVIDDFDMIYEAISPFWRLSGKEVLQAMQDAQRTGASELWYCRLSSGQAKTGCTHRHREFDRGIALLFDSLLGEELDGILDNVAFLVNHLDEPRVLLPPSAGDGDHRGFNLTFMSEQPTWNAVSRSCAARTNARGDQSTPRVEAFGIPFVANRAAMMDLCQHPEYKSTHGLFMSPTSFPLIEGLLPVLSTGSLSTMGDILFPSPAYLDPEFVYDGDRDVDWERKRNNLYWAGSTTGGFASTDEWPQFHRQRFVRLAQNLERRAHFYLRDREGLGARVASFFLNTRLYDVAFTRILQCARPHCRSQKAYFNMRRWADRDEALRSRLVFDLDGNGISGRYYRLLASKSTPLKQTLFREWHDERLVPWVHYIPVSQGMEELPELVFYLTSTESGQRIARDVAEQGREWFARSLRPVDMSIYVYRLLLELARLQDPERQAA